MINRYDYSLNKMLKETGPKGYLFHVDRERHKTWRSAQNRSFIYGQRDCLRSSNSELFPADTDSHLFLKIFTTLFYMSA